MKSFHIILSTLLLITALLPADETELLLEKLCNAEGPSGFEKPVRAILEKEWSNQSVEYTIDGAGNLVGTLPSGPKAKGKEKPKILVMAHMDEVGFLTTKVDDDGFIAAIPLGGWMDHVVWGKLWKIQVGNTSIPAVSGMDPPHVLSDFTKSPTVTKEQFFLDTGLTKAELDALGVRPGLGVAPDFRFTILKPGEKYLGKAFDDRAGLTLMVDLMKEFKGRLEEIDCQIVFAATVQEELGMRGSKAVYETLKPDIVLNIEAGIARDYPTQFTKGREPALGKGPTLFIYDGSMLPNQDFVAAIERIAKENAIPMQWEVENSYGQDASCLQMAGRGMPAVNIGIPVRYAHSHYGMIDRRDYDNTLKLVIKVIENMNAQFIERLP